MANRRNATRRALKAEIESVSLLDTLIRKDIIGGSPPAQILHPTTAYKGHIEEIGLLTEEEISVVTEFYSNAINTHDALKWNRELDLRVSLDSEAVDTGRIRRNNDIASAVMHLAVDRWKAAQILRKHLGEDYEPLEKMELPESEGDTVSKYHPILKPEPENWIAEGYFEALESDPDMYRLTEEGEEWLEESDYHTDHDLDHELSFA